MKKQAKNKSCSLKDILDSDDELPTEYIELPFVPAYQNDNRFEYIEEQKKLNEELLNKQHEEVTDELNDESIIAYGYLNKKDTFCFQSLASTTGENTLLWFFNFLMLKDLNCNFSFLTTCLVPKYEGVNTNSSDKSIMYYNERRHRHKIVVVPI